MTTKKFFLGLSLLVVAGLWTGCSNDEVVNTNEKQAISFRMQGGEPVLRATGTTIPYVNAFVVNAYGDATGSAKATMDAVTVYRVEGTGNVFDYNPKAFYFSEDANVVFAAYSPVSTSVTRGLGASGIDNEITYTVKTPDDNKGNTTQEDLLVAYTNQTTLDGTPVSLLFKHALSRVYVTAKNSLSSDVIINSISLVNLYSKGTLGIAADINNTYTSPVDNLGNYKILWTSPDEKITYSYVLPLSGVAVPSNTNDATYVVSMEQGMMVLPQTTTLTYRDQDINFTEDTDFYVEIAYTVANLKEKIKVPFADLNALDDAISGNNGLTFEFGRQYALNVDFSGTAAGQIEIKFTVEVEDWSAPIPVPNP